MTADELKAYKKKGWRVKLRRAKNGSGGGVDGFTLTKGHVYVRATEVHWRTWYQVFVRNENGGYDLRHKYTNFSDAIQLAESVLTNEEEPQYPSWNRDSLPEPMSINNGSLIWSKGMRMFPDHDSNQRGARKERFTVNVERLITEVRFIDIVSIAADCTVSVQASITPNNKAWFLVECSGTNGIFRLITDGETYYPVRRNAGGVYKVQFSNKVGSVELSALNKSDAQVLAIAVREYSNHLHKELK